MIERFLFPGNIPRPLSATMYYSEEWDGMMQGFDNHIIIIHNHTDGNDVVICKFNGFLDIVLNVHNS